MAEITETTATETTPSTNGKSTAKKATAKKKTPAKKAAAKKTPAKKAAGKGKAADGSARGQAKPANWKPERVLMAKYLEEAKPENMSVAQGRVLDLLAKARGPVDRPTIAEKCAISDSYVGVWVGRNDEAQREESEAKWGYCSLITMGYVKNKQVDLDGKQVWVYEITASGKKAIEKYNKAIAAKKAAAKE